MDRSRELAERLALILVVVGVIAGWIIGGVEIAVFGATVGFFSGQSIRSTVRTFTVDEGR